jgi:D-3-phosphoglycerate dehydrogenase
MTTPRVVVCDELDARAMTILRERGLEVEERIGMELDALKEAAHGAEGLVVRSATRIPREVIEAGSPRSGGRLKVVGRAGIGVDNVDREAATEHGVVVMNTPGGNTLSTAELALSLCLALARNLGPAQRRVREGSWSKKGLMGHEMTGKRLGVVGLGRVGKLLAERALGLQMEVVAYDPYLEPGAETPLEGVRASTLEELLDSSDFVSLHVPLVESTRNLIDAAALARMKPTAYVVNTSRGGVVDEQALLEALDGNRIAGAALDVLAQEPPAADHPLLRHERAILTPHLGASSQEAQVRVAEMIAEQLADFLLEGVARHAVNLPSFPGKPLEELAPVTALAERLGSIAAQSIDGPVRKLEVTAAGGLVGYGEDFLRLAVLVGTLRPWLGHGVNFVNAPLLASERSIRVLSSSESRSPFQGGHLEVRVESDEAEGAMTTTKLEGALFGRTPRLTRVDGVHVDMRSDGPLLMTRHADEPGVLGRIGTLLGEHGCNILRVELGGLPGSERSGKATALGLLRLDRKPDQEVVDALAAMRGIERVRVVEP